MLLHNKNTFQKMVTSGSFVQAYLFCAVKPTADLTMHGKRKIPSSLRMIQSRELAHFFNQFALQVQKDFFVHRGSFENKKHYEQKEGLR